MKYSIILLALIFLSCQKSALYSEKHTFYRMDTVIEVTIVVGDAMNEERGSVFKKIKGSFIRFFTGNASERIEDTWSKVDSLLKDCEIRFSQTHPHSEILRINTRSDRSMSVSPILAEMIHVGLRYGDTLHGMFDLTILPVKELWGFGEKDTQKVIPSADTIKSVLEHVDYQKVKVDIKENTLFFEDTKLLIDVGGVAKGFVLREIGKLLDKLNYNDYLIVAGGDILAKGRRPDRGAWRIAIKHPRKSDGLLGSFRLDTGSVVTSGDYERYWIHEGKRYHHIFNPKTGLCCRKNQSLTIRGMDPVVVDVLSTGLFCFPKDSILAFVEKRPLLECIVVDSLGAISISEGWKNKIRLYN